MSIEPRETCPTDIQTVMEIWQTTMAEARLSNADALSATSMLLGWVCLNAAQDEGHAHEMFSDTIWDIHKYIEANWEQAQQMKREARRRRGE